MVGMLWQRWHVVVTTVLASLVGVPLVVLIGRVASVDDVLQNAFGAVLGGLLTRGWWAGPPTGPTGSPSSPRPAAGTPRAAAPPG